MLERYRRILTTYRPQLVDEIEIESGSGLLNLLLSKSVLTNRQAKSISCLADPYKQIEAILDALHRRPDSDYFLFCDALSETGQQHIVDSYLQDEASQPAGKSSCESGRDATVPIQASDDPLEVVKMKEVKHVNLHPEEDNDIVCRHLKESHAIDNFEDFDKSNQKFIQDYSVDNPNNWSGHGTVCSDADYMKAVPKPSSQQTGYLAVQPSVPGTGAVGPTVFHNIRVQQSTMEFYELKKADSYNMTMKCRGRCVIINISHVIGFPPRNGSEQDVKLLNDLFLQLHFVVDIHKDLASHEMKQEILNLSMSPDLSSSQCLVLIVMSHGNTVYSSAEHSSNPASVTSAGEDVSVQNEVVFGSDGLPVTTRDLLAPLTNENCSPFRGKPRIVFFQACRGNEYDKVLTETDAMPNKVTGCELEDVSSQAKAVPVDIDLSDFIIGFPTQAGFRSFRNPDTGSWYVNAIVQVFMQRACDMDVSAMLRKVNEMVLNWLPWTRDPEMAGKGQVACISDNLKRPFLHLFPGIIIDR